MLGKVDQLLNDSGEILYILAEGGGKTFDLQHGRNDGFASELAGKTFTFVNRCKPSSARSCCGVLGPAGTARLCHSLSSRAPGRAPWSAMIPKPCWGTKHLGSHWLVWAKTREGLFCLMLPSWMLNSCTCAPVLLIFWYRQWQMKKKFMLLRGLNFRTLQKCRTKKISVFSQVRESQYLILSAQHPNKDLFT